MNLLLIIFLSGLAMKAVISLVSWLWNFANSETRWANASKPVAELGKLAPEEYLSIRSHVSHKVRHLSPTVSGLAQLPFASPNKKSA